MLVLDTDLVSKFIASSAGDQTPKLVAFVEARSDEIAIAFVTLYELRRGIGKLVRRGEGLKQQVALEKFLYGIPVLGLDDASATGWTLAARMWVDWQFHEPARTVTDADLLIAATAAFHRVRICDLRSTSRGPPARNHLPRGRSLRAHRVA